MRRFAPPPTTLRRAGVRLDTLAIVPARLLPAEPYRPLRNERFQQWREVARRHHAA
jgi:hypothetical protein